MSHTKNPKHVAIIMDGNRRWAAEKELPHIKGHEVALDRIEEIIEYSAKEGIEYLTMWAWSTKNWKRNAEFIEDVMSLFRVQLAAKGLFDRAITKGAKIHHIGTLGPFPQDIQEKFKQFIARDPEEKVIDVNIALNYEGREEIVRAVKHLVKNGADEDSITRESIQEQLDTAGQPDVDLVIRTGGEKRTSGFLIWQAADAEFYFTEDYMPDFGLDEYKKALKDFNSRERRMGGDSKKY